MHQSRSTSRPGGFSGQKYLGKWPVPLCRRTIRLAAFWVAASFALAAPPAASSDLGDFDSAVAAAYHHYREAAFYLRTGNVGAGAIALEQAFAGWQVVQGGFRDTPPYAYAEDARWSADLDQISADLEAGLAEADKGDGPGAAKALASVRTTLAALRERNGQWRFSDCVDQMNAEMDRLWRYRKAPPDLTSTEAVDQAKAQATVTVHWYRRCRAEAPAKLRDDSEFNRLMDGSIGSLELIPEALNERNEMRFINILREMRSFDRMIWLRFG